MAVNWCNLLVSSIEGLSKMLCICAYTWDFDSEPNISLISTTMEQGLSITKIPAVK